MDLKIHTLFRLPSLSVNLRFSFSVDVHPVKQYLFSPEINTIFRESIPFHRLVITDSEQMIRDLTIIVVL
jgi:hypothetical protein